MIERAVMAVALLAAPAVASAQATDPPVGTGITMPSTPTPPGAAMPMANGSGASGTDLPAGDAPPPPPPADRYADRTFGSAAMAESQTMFLQENGGHAFSEIMLNLAELQVGGGRPAYRWDGEGWFGGDLNRLVVKSEGSGESAAGVQDAEVQGLYSRAVDPYFDVQAGVREAMGPTPGRTDLTVGFEGLAPYWLKVEGALFVSTDGDVLGRLEGYYDENITQRLVLQPRVELNFAAQDIPRNRIGGGLSEAELGLRLRYEIRREFAPYVGVSWDRKVGRTADLVRQLGEDPSATTFVIGARAWF